MVTVKDVARACNVSASTVSNVITGKAVVHPRTRSLVQQTIRQMNYRPNAVARGLVQRRMNTLGVVYLHAKTVWQSNPFFGPLLDGVMAVATRAEMNTTLCTTSVWDNTGSIQSRICDGRCDGILLLVPPVDSDFVDSLTQTDLPIVLVNSKHPDLNISSVDVDNTEAAQQAVSYLIALGHQRIAMAVSPEDLHFVYGRERLEGYRCALENAGLTFDPTLLVDPDHMTQDVRRWKADLASAPTAVFCVFDFRALDLMRCLEEQGLRVPHDISVVGYDDIPAAAGSNPPLTTVRQPIMQIGERATELLLAQIAGEGEPGVKEMLPTELILRHSSAPPPCR